MARFRVNAVTIEGFRGFTIEQRVPLDGKHLFLFGPNGCGKSSIVEAIRYCLFGSPSGKQEIELRNTFYPHRECHVILEFSGPDGLLFVRRELRPGATESRLAITDAAGNDLLQREAFPKFARLGQEGMQVIFAAQQAPGRRTQVDISDFSKVLHFYLHLEDVPALLERVKNLLAEKECECQAMAQSLNGFMDGCRHELELVEARLTGLLRSPPWGDGPLPTHLDTQAKVDTFLREMSLLVGEAAPTGLSAEANLRLAAKWAGETASKTAREMQDTLRRQQEQLSRAEEMFRRIKEAEGTRLRSETEAERARSDLQATLQGEDPAEIARKFEVLEASLTLCDARKDLATRAKSLCEKHAVDQCPVCGAKYEDGGLAARVQEQIGQCQPAGEDLLGKVVGLRERLAKVREMEKSLEVLEDSIRRSTEAEREAREGLCTLFGIEYPSAHTEALELRVQEMRNAVAALEGQLRDAEAERKRREKRMKDLEEELRFHRERDEIQRIRTLLTSGTEMARHMIEEHVSLHKIAMEIVSVLDRAFASALQRAMPPLNEMLTDVYRRLTGQKSYDSVCIRMDPATPGSLELRVASSEFPGQDHTPTVLNGQAAKALQLVPYFVFSKFQPDVMELDLLLIDDPSQSFDTPHVDTLLQELAEAASHAQIVVATHEQNRFQPRLGDHFAPGSYGTIIVEHFEAKTGPRLDRG